ncbi:MAG: hypothetical protein ACP5OP_06975 [Leptospirillia bacterium]
MVWSHLHPALIHFAAGFGLLYLLWDLAQLTGKSWGTLPGERHLGEGAVGLFLVGVGTGWIALANDRILQNGGHEIFLGTIHGGMGLALLAGTTGRVLSGFCPQKGRMRHILAGVDLGLFLLLLGTTLLGERLVFIQGAGLSGVHF